MTNRDFESIYADYSRMVYWVAYGVVKNESDAMDISQNAFIKVLANIGKLRDMGDAQLKSWLYRVTTNLCVDLKRKLKHEVVAEELPEVSADEIEIPENAVLDADKRARVREAMDKLPEIYKETVLLHYFSGLRYDEIARLSGVSEGTVKSRMSRAKERLYALLKEGELYG